MGKKIVECSFCGTEISRQTRNYVKNQPIKNFFCNRSCKAKWQIKQREKLGFSKEWLIEEYVNKGKSSDQIAREIGRDPKTVWGWLVRYGIKVRPRGFDYGQGFKKGETSLFKGKKHKPETIEKLKEISKADGRLPYLKDGIHWLKHDGAYPASYKGGVSPDRQKVYSSEEWKKLVKDVWARDEATCQLCKEKHNSLENRGTFHIHHIKSFAENPSLRLELENLVLLCKKCHLWVHSKENHHGEFL